MAAMGGVAASLVAGLLLRGLAAWHPGTEIPVQFLVAPDGSTMAFAALIALLTGLLFGVIPARQALRTDPNQVLKSSGGTDVGSRRMAVRDLLLAVQIALCCLLVTASFVALRGLERTLRMPLGFQPEGVVLATMDIHLAGYQGRAGACSAAAFARCGRVHSRSSECRVFGYNAIKSGPKRYRDVCAWDGGFFLVQCEIHRTSLLRITRLF
jgi:hypothetical protein